MRSTLQESVRLLEETKAGELQLLRSAQNSAIAVISGQHDNIETLLEAAEISHTRYERLGAATKRNPYVVFVNCSDYDSFSGEEAVQRYVKEGGRIVTTDWALAVFSKSFPGYVVKGEEDIDDAKLPVSPANYLGVRLMGTKFAKKNPKWYFESSSHAIVEQREKQKSGKRITPLLVSEALQKKYETPLVAFGISYGKGEAIHFCSHLDAQEASSAAEGLKTDYSTMHAVLMLCTKMPVLYDPGASPEIEQTKSVLYLPREGTKSRKLLP